MPRQWIDEIDGREHATLHAEIAWVGLPFQAETVDQLRMFEVADQLVVIVGICSRIGMLCIGVGAEIGVDEQAIGGRACQAAYDRSFRRIVVGLVDQRRMKAEEIAPIDRGQNDGGSDRNPSGAAPGPHSICKHR
jgi:hypothetical protein